MCDGQGHRWNDPTAAVGGWSSTGQVGHLMGSLVGGLQWGWVGGLLWVLVGFLVVEVLG